MNAETNAELQAVIRILRNLDDQAIQGEVSHHYLEIRQDPQAKELRVSGNREGLIYLAMTILELAEQGREGSHRHFDEAGIVDHCDVPLVVSMREAPWDK